MVPRPQSRFPFLAAGRIWLAAVLLWLCGVLPAGALHAPDGIPISPKTRVGGFGALPAGRLPLREQFGSINAPGKWGCGYEIVSGRREWKLYGPDINGVYGGANGTGGFEAVSPYLTLFEPTISDFRGNILGVITNGATQWNPARPTGYGAVPGYRPVALGNGASISLSSAWRGRWADITGYHSVGARTYDPVSGHWLSFDPAWNGLDPNGFSAFGGDPINFFDRDGRVSQNLYADQATHDQIANAFQDYVEEESWNTPGMNGPAQPGSLAYLLDYVNYFGWPADSSQELQYVGGHSSIQFGDFADNSSGFSLLNTMENTDARDYALQQWNEADWHSGWGITMKVASGFDYGVNTLDAGANMIPIVGGVKSVAETAVKAVVEDVTKSFAEDVGKSVVDDVADDGFTTFYHGTASPEAAANIRANGIDLSFSRPNLDFGAGFYTTTDEAQAQAWAARQGGEVLTFQVPNSELANFNQLTFSSADSDWASFVYGNRSGTPLHDFDVVNGPMLGNPRAFLNGAAPTAFGQQTSFHTQSAVDWLGQYLIK